MAHNIGLTFHSIQFRKRRSDDLEVISSLESPDHRYLTDAIKAIINGMPQQPEGDTNLPDGANKEHTQYFICTLESDLPHEVSGVIKSGGIAENSDFYEDGSPTLVFSATANKHKKYLPFFYHFDVPNNSKTTIVALQTYGVFGVRTSFLRRLEYDLRKAYPDYTVDVRVIHVGPIFVKKWLSNAVLKDLEITRFSSTGEISDDNQQAFKGKLVLSPLKNAEFPSSWIEKIKGSLGLLQDQPGESVKQVVKGFVNELWGISLDDEEEIHSASINVDIGGYDRRIPLTNLSSFATKIDITKEIDLDIDGQPIFHSILKKAKDLVNNSIRSPALINE